MLPYAPDYGQYASVYNALSFVMASMGASTIYFFFHAHLVQHKYRTALCISGLVTLIAFYHYMRMFNSWTEAYTFPAVTATSTIYAPVATGAPYNDAYRYMDWLLTVPLLLIELILVMDLDSERTQRVSTQLGVAAALMIVLGYPGEITMDHGTRWIFWTLAMIPFCFIVYTLFIGLADAVERQPADAKSLVSQARYVTIISWLTYPVVYILPMLGVEGDSAFVSIQIGYSMSDFISKCVVGLMIVKIAMKKSQGKRTDGVDGALNDGLMGQ